MSWRKGVLQESGGLEQRQEGGREMLQELVWAGRGYAGDCVSLAQTMQESAARKGLRTLK